MPNEKLTFNDLPEVVGKLCERIESLENALKDNFAKQVPVKENLHVPMTVEEVCSYLGISKSSFYYKAKHGGIPVIKHGSGLFVCPGHTYDRFFDVVSQILRSRNIAARLFHIPTFLLIWPYVLSQQASARVPPRNSEAPGFFFRSPAICPVRRDIRTDASPA